MAQTVISRRGKSLAIRIPCDVARAAGLSAGEHVEIEAIVGGIILRRAAPPARRLVDAQAAAAEIIAESRHYQLGNIPVRELREDGRRG